MQLATPNVVAMAVRIVIMMLRIFPQVLLLLNVPIVVEFFNGIELIYQGLVSVCKDTAQFLRFAR
jgi:hypothetical protein